MPEWLSDHAELLTWLFVSSLVLLVGSAVLLPAVITALPPDHFVGTAREHRERRPWWGWLLWALRNLIGGLFIAGGILMLVLPGQGLLTIFVGLMFLEFPGKHRLEQRLLAHDSILRPLNWIREKVGRPPLIGPDD